MSLADEHLLEVAWFLSKYGEQKPPAVLSVSTWKEAFALFYPRFGNGKTSSEFHNSLKNSRDRFDSWLSNTRRGWRNPDDSPAEISVAAQDVMARMDALPLPLATQRILSLITEDKASSEKLDIAAIENDKQLDETARQRLIAARLGQGEFRKNCLKLFPACPVTKIDFQPLLRASHIKPWSACTSAFERLDPHNGIMLAAHIDILFDKGWISFDYDGSIIISSELETSIVRQLALANSKVGVFPEASHPYLEWHQDQVLRP